MKPQRSPRACLSTAATAERRLLGPSVIQQPSITTNRATTHTAVQQCSNTDTTSTLDPATQQTPSPEASSLSMRTPKPSTGAHRGFADLKPIRTERAIVQPMAARGGAARGSRRLTQNSVAYCNASAAYRQGYTFRSCSAEYQGQQHSNMLSNGASHLRDSALATGGHWAAPGPRVRVEKIPPQACRPSL
jgi:hypothetical protein